MSVDRSALIGGPAKVVLGAGTFFSKGDFNFNIIPETVPVETSMHGKIDEAEVDARVEVTLDPAEYENLSILYPTSFLTPVIGARIFGDSDTACVLTALNGETYTLKAAAITKLAPIHLGAKKTTFGQMTITGLRGNNLDADGANSLYTIAAPAAVTYSDSTFSPAAIAQQKYGASWGAITGFSSFQAEEGWDIEFDLKLEPVNIDGVGTVDMKIVGLDVMAKCKPVGPTPIQIDTNARVQGSGMVQGRRYGAGIATTDHDLVITGTTPSVSVTIKAAQLKTAGFVFGGKPLRNGEVGWISTVLFGSGVAGARAVIA